jgi:hypothetical protein
MTVLVYRSLSREQFLGRRRTCEEQANRAAAIGVSATFGYLISLYSVAALTGRPSRRHDGPVAHLPAGQYHPVLLGAFLV